MADQDPMIGFLGEAKSKEDTALEKLRALRDEINLVGLDQIGENGLLARLNEIIGDRPIAKTPLDVSFDKNVSAFGLIATDDDLKKLK